MSELVSANWNNIYGMENAKLVLNKVSNFGSIPMNQHYIFFNNGATSMLKDDKDLNPEVKKALENEKSKRSNKGSYGLGSMRPVGFTESQMSDLFYNSYGLDIDIGSIAPAVDPLTVALLLGGYTSLLGLLVSQSIGIYIQSILVAELTSAIKLQLPKIGNCDFYTYETKKFSQPTNNIFGDLVKRKHPYVDKDNNNKIQKGKLINLSSESGFKKTMGKSSYDTLLSKYQLNGGSSFYFNPFKSSKQDSQNFVEDLIANKDIKYSQLAKISRKYQSDTNFIQNSQTSETSILINMKNNINGKGYFGTAGGVTNLNLYIDFLDYIPIKISSSQKGYPNPEKEKSIFGPYICRSRKSFIYYPKIIIDSPVFSTLLDIRYSGFDFGGGINVFGAPVSCFSTVNITDSRALFVLTKLVTLGLPPNMYGTCNYLTKERAFNLGAAYTDGDLKYNPYKACPGCP